MFAAGQVLLGAAHACISLGELAGIGGRADEGIALLFEAIDAGLPPDAAANMGRDPDLNALRGHPRFPALVARAKEAASAHQKSS